VIGKRLRSPEKDAVVAQVFRDGFFSEYAYSRRISRLEFFITSELENNENFQRKMPRGWGLLLNYQFLENSQRYWSVVVVT